LRVPGCRLEKLYLSLNRIGDAGAAALGDALSHCPRYISILTKKEKNKKEKKRKEKKRKEYERMKERKWNASVYFILFSF
jgi:DNA repair photolyase